MSEERRTPDAPRPAPLVEVWRGSLIESRHRGHIAAVDGTGRIVARLGGPETTTFMRSSAKPLQAIPLLTSGAADRFGFDERELAIACASHSGQDLHAETVAGMLRKLGLDESALRCGVHEPFDQETAARLRERGESPSALRNNCSGKHTGMLALALHLGAAPESYDRPDGPVQRAILRAVAAFSGLAESEVAVGVDGCGVPVYGMPIQSMALAYARLAAPPARFGEPTRRAAARVVAAMMAHPEMIGGTVERFDTQVMRAARGRVISKVGAEGVYTAGVLPGDGWPEGLGLAFKIEDGEDRRGRPTVAIECLRQLGVLNGDALEALSPYSKFPVHNHRGEIVGKIRPSFELERV